jgi:hypothetical protein
VFLSNKNFLISGFSRNKDVKLLFLRIIKRAYSFKNLDIIGLYEILFVKLIKDGYLIIIVFLMLFVILLLL